MPAPDSPAEDRADERIEERMRLSRLLSRSGYPDVLVLSRESGSDVLTETRMEILDSLGGADPPSVRALAKRLGRDKASVSRDLKVLAGHDVVEYESDGRAKAPRLKHETVIVEPLV